jgi:hypothetical protein
MWLTLVALVIAISAAAGPRTQAPHAKSFWQSIVQQKFEPPAGTPLAQLVDELLGNLGSPDPELRDDLSLTILTAWIYQKKLLGPDELRRITATLEANLKRGIGERGGDGVLLRSFSALTLSVIAARENETPFLTAAEFHELLAVALAYLRDEQDLRGYDPERGWMHSAAHTSDLLKFLARNPRLEPSGQGTVLAALLAKNTAAAAPFAQGEDERMARVVVSVIRRNDFDRDGFSRWLASATAAARFPDPVSAGTLRAQQNVRHLLVALWAELSTDERPSDGADAAKSALRGALKAAGF